MARLSSRVLHFECFHVLEPVSWNFLGITDVLYLENYEELENLVRTSKKIVLLTPRVIFSSPSMVPCVYKATYHTRCRPSSFYSERRRAFNPLFRRQQRLPLLQR